MKRSRRTGRNAVALRREIVLHKREVAGDDLARLRELFSR